MKTCENCQDTRCGQRGTTSDMYRVGDIWCHVSKRPRLPMRKDQLVRLLCAIVFMSVVTALSVAMLLGSLFSGYVVKLLGLGG